MQSVVHNTTQKHTVDALLDLVPHRPDHFPAAALEKRPAHRIVGPSDQAHLPELPRGRLRDHRVEKRPPDALPPMSFRNGDLVDPAACRPGPQVAIALDLAVPLGNGYEGPPGRGRIIKASCIRFPVEAVRVGKTLFSQPGKGRERPAERRYPVRSSCRVPAGRGYTSSWTCCQISPHLGPSRAARSMASTRLASLAIPLPAMSKAVPWSTEVRMMGRPTVTLTPSSK